MNEKLRFLIKSGYYIVPSPSTALNHTLTLSMRDPKDPTYHVINV